jgi:membrane-associated phospholipid phosphatase
MLAITELGNPTLVPIIFIVVLGIIWWRGNPQQAKIFLLACLGAFILNTELKLVFRKNRPQLWQPIITEKSFSFPSGHALGSLVLYGLIAYLLGNKYPQAAKLIYAFTVFLIAAIGLSRLYLGVHWPTDILAGYAIGFLWLMICIVMLKLQKQRQGL